MKNKSIVLVSIALVAFLLVIGTGIITNVFAKDNAATVSTPDLNEFLVREQQYQNLINEANQKITTANQQITDLVKQANEATAVSDTPYLFTAQQASQIAANLAGLQPTQVPELVDFDNKPAYEVKFDEGKFIGKVYIDANTGAVLYNGLAQKATYITTEQAISIATNYLGGGTVVQVYFGSYDGSKVYIVQFADGLSVYVDLRGEIKAVQMAPSISNSDDDSHESEEHSNDD